MYLLGKYESRWLKPMLGSQHLPVSQNLAIGGVTVKPNGKAVVPYTIPGRDKLHDGVGMLRHLFETVVGYLSLNVDHDTLGKTMCKHTKNWHLQIRQ